MPILDKNKTPDVPPMPTTVTSTPCPIAPKPPSIPSCDNEKSAQTDLYPIYTNQETQTDAKLIDPPSLSVLLETIEKLREKEKHDAELIETLREANKQHVKDKNALRRELHAERQKVKSLLDRKIPDAEKRKIAEDLLTPYMGETATKCFIKGKGGKFSKPRQWTKDEIILGVTLRTISKKVYNILRVRNIIPMPHPSTLRRYYADFQITEGKWHSVAFYLKLFYDLLQFSFS